MRRVSPLLLVFALGATVGWLGASRPASKASPERPSSSRSALITFPHDGRRIVQSLEIVPREVANPDADWHIEIDGRVLYGRPRQ